MKKKILVLFVLNFFSVPFSARASECYSISNNAISYRGQHAAEKKVQFLVERNAKGDKFLVGIPEIASVDASHKDTIVIQYNVGLIEYYSINDKESVGSRDVLVVLNRENCKLVGSPLDLGAVQE